MTGCLSNSSEYVSEDVSDHVPLSLTTQRALLFLDVGGSRVYWTGKFLQRKVTHLEFWKTRLSFRVMR